jgi:hypothetical protein
MLLATLLASSMAASVEAAVRVYAKVEAETAIYAGDQFVYSVVVEGGSKPSRIDVSPLASFNPIPRGSNTSTEIINGQTSVSYSQNYVVTAGPVGKMTLPGVTVVVDGQTYTTDSVEVTVSQPGTTDRLSLGMSLSEKQCYVGQPVVMKVEWIITTRVEGGAFNVPVFKSDDFYIEDLSEPVNPQNVQQVAIGGVPVAITVERRLIKGVDAQVVSFSKVLIPKRSGRIPLDPISVSTNMATSQVRTNDFFNPYQIKYERVSVQSDPAELQVLPLPDVGKPPQFYGLVGQYTISASATPTKVNVGDPITLTIRIGGNPYLKPVQWPALEQLPELAGNFKVPSEKASPAIENGTKVFTQTIRANNDRVAQIPAIPLAYFDPQKGQYVVARTDPIKLEVAPTKLLTDADVERTGSAPANREVEAIQKGLSANYYGPEVLANQSFSPLSAVVSPVYAALWLIPLMALIASSAVKLARRTSPESLARKHRRQAAGVAIRQLKKVASAEAVDLHELLAGAMKAYIGERFDRVAGSLTADDCGQAIAQFTGDTAAAASYRELIMACEAASYTPMDAHVGPDEIGKAIELIQLIEKRSRK